MDNLLHYPPVKVYAKQELACMYLPHTSPRSAVKTLVSWIRHNDELCMRLRALHYNKYRHTFYAHEVALIFTYLGPP